MKIGLKVGLNGDEQLSQKRIQVREILITNTIVMTLVNLQIIQPTTSH